MLYTSFTLRKKGLSCFHRVVAAISIVLRQEPPKCIIDLKHRNSCVKTLKACWSNGFSFFESFGRESS